MKSIFITFVIILGLAFSVPCSTHAGSILPDSGKKTYGDYDMNDLVSLTIRVTNIILALSGSLALGVIIYGGFMMTLAGLDPKNADTGKRALKGSFIGLLIVFSAYTAVNFIFTSAGKKDWSIVKSSPVKPYKSYEISQAITELCVDCFDKSKNSFNFGGTIKSTAMPGSCGSYDFSAGGEYENLLAAMAAQESGCQESRISPKGACGIMQIKPDTAKAYARSGENITCAWLNENPERSIEIATAFINANKNVHNGNVDHILAGYNAGYGKVASDGKKGAFAASDDCPGLLAYQCAIDPGGLAQTQEYIVKVKSYYSAIR